MGFPIVEVEFNGECIITKEKDTGGLVEVGTATTQLIYEIQGPLYYNSDVTADLESVEMEELGENRVRVSGVKGTHLISCYQVVRCRLNRFQVFLLHLRPKLGELYLGPGHVLTQFLTHSLGSLQMRAIKPSSICFSWVWTSKKKHAGPKNKSANPLVTNATSYRFSSFI